MVRDRQFISLETKLSGWEFVKRAICGGPRSSGPRLIIIELSIKCTGAADWSAFISRIHRPRPLPTILNRVPIFQVNRDPLTRERSRAPTPVKPLFPFGLMALSAQKLSVMNEKRVRITACLPVSSSNHYSLPPLFVILINVTPSRDSILLSDPWFFVKRVWI